MSLQRGRPPQPNAVLPEGDIILMIYLVADLNPDHYKHPEARATIHRAKAIKEQHTAHPDDLALVIE